MRLFYTIICIVVLSSCKDTNKPSMEQNANDPGETLARFQDDDQKMNKAIDEAKASYADFLEVFKKGCEGCERFQVKQRFENEDGGEHIWIDELFLKNDNLFGELANIPHNEIGLDIGDTIEVKTASLSDWMYIQKGKLVGGYTIKVIYDGMTAPEKKQLEEDFGAAIR